MVACSAFFSPHRQRLNAAWMPHQLHCSPHVSRESLPIAALLPMGRTAGHMDHSQVLRSINCIQSCSRADVELDCTQWTARNPRAPLGNASMNRSSKAWDSIAIAALGTELQVWADHQDCHLSTVAIDCPSALGADCRQSLPAAGRLYSYGRYSCAQACTDTWMTWRHTLLHRTQAKHSPTAIAAGAVSDGAVRHVLRH